MWIEAIISWVNIKVHAKVELKEIIKKHKYYEDERVN